MTSDESMPLREIFDRAAELYHGARPDYPAALYNRLIALTGITAGSELLEIGCATGKATVPLAARGLSILAVELGPALAEVARHNLGAFPRVTVEVGAFETWPTNGRTFDLVFAATAWHWLDPAVRYRRAHQLLRPGGHLAFWGATHVFPPGGDPFFDGIQDVYVEIGEAKPGDSTQPRPGELPDSGEEILSSGLFNDVQVDQFAWEIDYSSEAYLNLLNTFSGHLAMPADRRDHLYAEIRRRIASRPSGTVRRGWGAVLHVARRID